jgi:SET domain-containing protein
VEYTGERLNLTEFLIRQGEIWKPGGIKQLYIFRLNRRCYIDGAVGGCGAEFINHSCDPNLRVRKIRGHIHFFTRRRVGAGEELTFDYRLNRKAMRRVCCCCSHNCRGTLYRK